MWKMTALVIRFLVAATPAIIPATSHAADDVKKIVADLDTQYQLAVKNHDVATMDRILADDFVLATGRGTSFTKADLLKEAHGGTVYERQEDTQQTVRVWGDTAVVTALLWAKGHRGRQAIRLQALVQRRIRTHPGGLALRVRSGVAAAAQGALMREQAVPPARGELWGPLHLSAPRCNL